MEMTLFERVSKRVQNMGMKPGSDIAFGAKEVLHILKQELEREREVGAESPCAALPSEQLVSRHALIKFLKKEIRAIRKQLADGGHAEPWTLRGVMLGYEIIIEKLTEDCFEPDLQPKPEEASTTPKVGYWRGGWECGCIDDSYRLETDIECPDCHYTRPHLDAEPPAPKVGIWDPATGNWLCGCTHLPTGVRRANPPLHENCIHCHYTRPEPEQATVKEPEHLVGFGDLTRKDWRRCPICGESGMPFYQEKKPNGDEGYLRCMNLNCGSNGGINFSALPTVKEPEGLDARLRRIEDRASAAADRILQADTEVLGLLQRFKRFKRDINAGFGRISDRLDCVESRLSALEASGNKTWEHVSEEDFKRIEASRVAPESNPTPVTARLEDAAAVEEPEASTVPGFGAREENGYWIIDTPELKKAFSPKRATDEHWNTFKGANEWAPASAGSEFYADITYRRKLEPQPEQFNDPRYAYIRTAADREKCSPKLETDEIYAAGSCWLEVGTSDDFLPHCTYRRLKPLQEVQVWEGLWCATSRHGSCSTAEILLDKNPPSGGKKERVWITTRKPKSFYEGGE